MAGWSETIRGFVIKLEGGRFVPRVRCHRCGQDIDDLGMAVIVFPGEMASSDIVKPVVEAVVLCKGNQCSMSPEYRNWLWMDLGNFLCFALFNMGIRSKEKLLNLWENSELMADI